jgi:hypothetical protein
MLQRSFSRARLIAVGAILAQACLAPNTLAQQEPTHGGTLVFGINSGDPPTTTATNPRFSRSSTYSRRTIPTFSASTLAITPMSSAISPRAGRFRTT